MTAIIDERLAARKRRVEERLDKSRYSADRSLPILHNPNVRFELAGRGVGTSYGGVALAQQLVWRLGLAQAIDERLHVFKVHLPYHESDHVLNLGYNALCAGRSLDDLELRRQDEAYLDLLSRPADSRSDHGGRLLPPLHPRRRVSVARGLRRGSPAGVE